MYGLTEWMVGWNPGKPDEVHVGVWPDRSGWTRAYSFTDGCCMRSFHDASDEIKVALVFIVFHTLVVRDGVSVDAAHREFLKIDEYRRRISPDIPGAED